MSNRLIVNDQRDDVELYKKGVICRDKCLSGWGLAKGGSSWAIWAGPPELNYEKLYDWVNGRSDSQYVRIVEDINKYRPPRTAKHLTIYVIDENHISQKLDRTDK